MFSLFSNVIFVNSVYDSSLNCVKDTNLKLQRLTEQVCFLLTKHFWQDLHWLLWFPSMWLFRNPAPSSREGLSTPGLHCHLQPVGRKRTWGTLAGGLYSSHESGPHSVGNKLPWKMLNCRPAESFLPHLLNTLCSSHF